MPDRKQVIWDIERCICHVPDACRDCSKYKIDGEICMETLMADALAIIREQEPIKPIFPHNVPAFPRCGACSHMLVGPPLTADSEIKYCWSCGKAVKWE